MLTGFFWRIDLSSILIPKIITMILLMNNGIMVTGFYWRISLILFWLSLLKGKLHGHPSPFWIGVPQVGIFTDSCFWSHSEMQWCSYLVCNTCNTICHIIPVLTMVKNAKHATTYNIVYWNQRIDTLYHSWHSLYVVFFLFLLKKKRFRKKHPSRIRTKAMLFPIYPDAIYGYQCPEAFIS